MQEHPCCIKLVLGMLVSVICLCLRHSLCILTFDILPVPQRLLMIILQFTPAWSMFVPLHDEVPCSLFFSQVG